MKAAALLVIVFAAVGCRDRMNDHLDLQRMRAQPRYDAYEGSRFFADGKVMQRPPAGTIPREAQLGTEGPDAATTAHAPPATPQLVALGGTRFGIYCAVCHGPEGSGKSIVGSNMDPPKPPPLVTAAIQALSPGTLYGVITNGFGNMPSYAAQLSPRERWAVVDYVRALQRTPPASRAPAGARP